MQSLEQKGKRSMKSASVQRTFPSVKQTTSHLHFTPGKTELFSKGLCSSLKDPRPKAKYKVNTQPSKSMALIKHWEKGCEA